VKPLAPAAPNNPTAATPAISRKFTKILVRIKRT